VLLGFNGATTMRATFALANAAGEVKAAVGYVSPYEDGDGVVDILRRWVEQFLSSQMKMLPKGIVQSNENVTGLSFSFL